MCGIAAIFSPGAALDPAALQSAVASMPHRGPDEQKTWIGPQGRVGLGHARLSIIDLVSGSQPLTNEEETIHLVVNGELYGFERIRQTLITQGHRFRTQSDSEILIHLYEEYGTDCLHHLRGEFAFALWDARRQTLFCGRDRFGMKPLYYAAHGGSLYLASEVKALHAAGVPAGWDMEGFIQAVQLGSPMGDRSLFAGVKQIPPGHFLLATAGHTQIQKYWDFQYPLEGQHSFRSDAQCREKLRSVLDEAVHLRLRADVPVACYLSGGIDSSAILALAMQHAPQPLHAFTLAFDLDAYDEAAMAEVTARHCGAKFEAIPVRQSEFADHFSSAVRHAEMLIYNSHGIAKFMLSRAVRDAGYKVVLTGEGSDEILGGYAHFRQDQLLQRYLREPEKLESELRSLAERNQVSVGTLLSQDPGLESPAALARLGFTPSWLSSWKKRQDTLRRFFDPAFARVMLPPDPIGELLDRVDVRGQLLGRERVHQSMYLWSKTFLPNYILSVLGDRMEMAHSIEGRVPFLDHHVVEAVAQMPMSVKIHGQTEKWVLREAVRDLLPAAAVDRQKHPFFAPPAAAKPKEPLHGMLQDLLRGSAVRKVPFVDGKRLTRMLDEIEASDEASRTASDPLLMSLASAALLAENFGL